MPHSADDSPQAKADADQQLRHEQLYDEYLNAVVDGQAERPSEFLLRHGVRDEQFKRQLESMFEAAVPHDWARASPIQSADYRDPSDPDAGAGEHLPERVV